VIRFVSAAILFCVCASFSFAIRHPNQPTPLSAQTQRPAIVSASGKRLESIFDGLTLPALSNWLLHDSVSDRGIGSCKISASNLPTRNSGFGGCQGHYLEPVSRRCPINGACNYYEDGETFTGTYNCGCPIWNSCFNP
jgi:hypothetical protein